MKCLADENVDAQIVAALRSLGHEVVYIAEDHSGISDDFVLRKSVESGAVLITCDKDFGDLVFRQRKSGGGILLLRLAGKTSDEKVAIVCQAFLRYEAEFVDTFSVLTPTSLRIRKR